MDKWKEFIKGKEPFGMDEVYDAAKGIEWTEEEKKVGEGERCYRDPKHGYAICFYIDGSVELFNPSDEKLLAGYTTLNNWHNLFNPWREFDLNNPQDREEYEDYKPLGPYIPRALDDNAMYFMNTEGRIYVYHEDATAKYARELVDLCRKAWEEKKMSEEDLLSVPEIKALYDKYDGSGQLCVYRDYETFIKYHITSDDYEHVHPIKWLKIGDDIDIIKDGENYLKRCEEETKQHLEHLDKTKAVVGEGGRMLVNKIIQLRKEGMSKQEIAEKLVMSEGKMEDSRKKVRLNMTENVVNNILKIHTGEGELQWKRKPRIYTGEGES